MKRKRIESIAGCLLLSAILLIGSPNLRIRVSADEVEPALEVTRMGTLAGRKAAENQAVTILMVGDILLHTPVEESAKREDGTYDFHAIFSHTQGEIAAADLALVNQEVMIGGAELGISGYPAFNAPYEIGDALVDAGFDVVCQATNHALDKGAKGINNCMNYWTTAHPQVEVLGIHQSAEDQATISYFEQKGIRIAILNYTYGTNGVSLPKNMPYAVDLMEEGRVKKDLAEAEEKADFTVVVPHWGTEYQLQPSSYQKKWAKIFEEGGADLVIGAHPHVIEPVEWIENTQTGHRMLCYYSLGNFVNWTSGAGKGVANRMVGGMAVVELKKTGNDVTISNYGVEALVCHLTLGTDGVSTYFLRDYSEEMGQGNAIRSRDGSFSYRYCVDLCNEVWGDLWY